MHRRQGRLAEQEEFGPAEASEVAADPIAKRVRARWSDTWILDSDEALLAWIEGPTPDYAVPTEDVDAEIEAGAPRKDERLGEVEDVTLVVGEDRLEAAGVRVREPPTEAQRLRGHVVLDWDAVDAWYVEDERQRGHPKDPYHRIDVHRSSRPVTVEVGGETVAESESTLAVFETGMPFRFYLPPVDVRMDLLRESQTQTRCAYKGQARYFHVEAGGERVEDAAWTYPTPEPRFARLQDLVCFHQEKVRMVVADTELM